MPSPFDALASQGWAISDEGKSWLLSASPDEDDGHGDERDEPGPLHLSILNKDIRKFGAKAFRDEWNSAESAMITGPLVVQLVALTNIAAPSINQSGGGERMLMLRLTDGHSKLVALEYERCPSLSLNTPPGTKIRLSNVPIRRGKLLLNPSNTTVLGGHVSALVESWRTQREIALRKKAELAIDLSLKKEQDSDLLPVIAPTVKPVAGAGAGASATATTAAAAAAILAGPPPFIPFAAVNKSLGKGKGEAGAGAGSSAAAPASPTSAASVEKRLKAAATGEDSGAKKAKEDGRGKRGKAAEAAPAAAASSNGVADLQAAIAQLQLGANKGKRKEDGKTDDLKTKPRRDDKRPKREHEVEAPFVAAAPPPPLPLASPPAAVGSVASSLLVLPAVITGFGSHTAALATTSVVTGGNSSRGRGRGSVAAIPPPSLSHAALSSSGQLPPQLVSLLQSSWGSFAAARDEALGFGSAPPPSKEASSYASSILRLPNLSSSAVIPVELVGLKLAVAAAGGAGVGGGAGLLQVHIEAKDYRLSPASSSLDLDSDEREALTAALSEDCKRDLSLSLSVNAASVAWASAELKILQRSFHPAPAFAVAIDFSMAPLPIVSHLLLLQPAPQQVVATTAPASVPGAVAQPVIASSFPVPSSTLMAKVKQQRGGGGIAVAAPPPPPPASINPKFKGGRRGGVGGAARAGIGAGAGAGGEGEDDDTRAYQDEPECQPVSCKVKFGGMQMRRFEEGADYAARMEAEAEEEEEEEEDELARLDRDIPDRINPLLAYAATRSVDGDDDEGDDGGAGGGGRRGGRGRGIFRGGRGAFRGARDGTDGGFGGGRGGRGRGRGRGDEGIGAPATRTLAAFL